MEEEESDVGALYVGREHRRTQGEGEGGYL